MARGAFPSMTALLGLLAVAGYQNRDKLAELLGNRAEGGSIDDRRSGMPARPAGLDTLLSGLGGTAGAGGLGSILGGGLKELAERFRQNGRGEAVESWINSGPNMPMPASELEHAVGADVIENLMEHTGLSRDDLLARLTRELPDAVDKYTPDGRMPDGEDDARRWS
jgi:uncharacterized protein YidB (DUF937 family)